MSGASKAKTQKNLGKMYQNVLPQEIFTYLDDQEFINAFLRIYLSNPASYEMTIRRTIDHFKRILSLREWTSEKGVLDVTKRERFHLSWKKPVKPGTVLAPATEQANKIEKVEVTEDNDTFELDVADVKMKREMEGIRSLQEIIQDPHYTDEELVRLFQILRNDKNTLNYKKKYGDDADDLEKPLVETNMKFTLLSLASKKGYGGMVKYLVENGAVVNVITNHGYTPLSGAAGNGHSDVVRYLVVNGANMHQADNNGRTPLVLAARGGYGSHGDVVMYLVDNGADVNAMDNDGRTPLSWAAWKGHGDVVRYLVEHGADVSARVDDGRTPLSGAAGNGHVDVVMHLVENGSEVDARSDDGTTPLAYAAYYGHVDVVRYLVEHGANVRAMDTNGYTPLVWAETNGHVDVADYLQPPQSQQSCTGPSCNIQGGTKKRRVKNTPTKKTRAKKVRTKKRHTKKRRAKKTRKRRR